MPSEVDTAKWSGEGTFTQVVVDRLRELGAVKFVRVENAPATRSEADYNFISNEIYVEFTTAARQEPVKRFGILPGTRSVEHKTMTLAELEKLLTTLDGIGAPDYGDEGMLQYLRAERIVPAYQTRGYKLVEMVRIYEVGTPSRA